jgi:hypothetical protein
VTILVVLFEPEALVAVGVTDFEVAILKAWLGFWAVLVVPSPELLWTPVPSFRVPSDFRISEIGFREVPGFAFSSPKQGSSIRKNRILPLIKVFRSLILPLL